MSEAVEYRVLPAGTHQEFFTGEGRIFKKLCYKNQVIPITVT